MGNFMGKALFHIKVKENYNYSSKVQKINNNNRAANIYERIR